MAGLLCRMGCSVQAVQPGAPHAGPSVASLRSPSPVQTPFRNLTVCLLPCPAVPCCPQGAAAGGAAGAAEHAGTVHGPLAPGPQPAGPGTLLGLYGHRVIRQHSWARLLGTERSMDRWTGAPLCCFPCTAGLTTCLPRWHATLQPAAAPRTLALYAELADTIWHASGDTSTDLSWQVWGAWLLFALSRMAACSVGTLRHACQHPAPAVLPPRSCEGASCRTFGWGFMLHACTDRHAAAALLLHVDHPSQVHKACAAGGCLLSHRALHGQRLLAG